MGFFKIFWNAFSIIVRPPSIDQNENIQRKETVFDLKLCNNMFKAFNVVKIILR